MAVQVVAEAPAAAAAATTTGKEDAKWEEEELPMSRFSRFATFDLVRFMFASPRHDLR